VLVRLSPLHLPVKPYDMRIFLIEDEFLHAEDVRVTVEALGHDFLGWIGEGFAAMEKIAAEGPDVVLIDMNLHGALSGPAIAAQIAAKFALPFIFITSHVDDETIQKGLVLGPVAYLTKPVREGDLKAALQKAVMHNREPEDSKAVVDDRDGLFVRVGNNLRPLHTAELLYVQTHAKNYCRLFLMDGTSFTIKRSLTSIQDYLTKEFFRVHKEYIVNTGSITKVDEVEQILYLGKQAVPIGNAFKKEFFQRFRIL
jgi:two-component system, LytTR family, response regulator LytT